MSFHPFKGLTGGGNNALDGVASSTIVGEDDIAIGEYNNAFVMYRWNATSTDTESVPSVITPDDSTGAGRWVLSDIRADAATLGSVVMGTTTINAIRTILRATGTADDTSLVTEKGFRDALDALINAAPGALDTLNELAAALGDDASFASTMTTALAGKSATTHDHDSDYEVAPAQNDEPTTTTLTTAECTNQILTNRGQTATSTLTLATPAPKMKFTYIQITTGQITHLKPPSGYIINFDGTDLDANDKITVSATASKWDKIVFIAITDDGGTTWKWMAETVRGSGFTDGGP